LTDASRDPILLLHGQPGSARDWDGVVASLDPAVESIAIDRPGWDGRSSATDLDGNADAALTALDRVGATRATVLGHSFGAAVAAWLAVREPERVGALVLAAPAVNVASLYALDRWLAIPVAGEVTSAAALAGVGTALSTGPLRRVLADRLRLDDRYLASAGRRLTRRSTWRSFAVEQRVLVGELPRLERRLGEISAPTTIVAGTRDYVVPASSIRQLAGQMSGARVRWLPGAGHLLPVRRASELAEIAADAVASPSRGTVPGRPG
jgi:pimeloyl-ACP methyl ester carboxylesterase